MRIDKDKKRKRKKLFKKVQGAFGDKYSWLGAQVSEELLLSAATWNIERYSRDSSPIRYRTHVMLLWEQGWIKSTLLRNMKKVLGDSLCSTAGKVTDAAIRGSVSAGRFTPPKPLKTPIMVSTELGQTNFDDELLGMLLALLEEGTTNISMNKIAQLSESKKQKLEDKYGGRIHFGENNEFDLHTDFVMWGATHSPQTIDDDLSGRFNIVIPAKPLTGEITREMDKSSSVLSGLDKQTVRDIRREIRSENEVPIDFTPPDKFYTDFNLNPRESRDVQSYMAARNWWGLDVSPQIMSDYIKFMRRARERVEMDPKDRVFNLIFDNAKTYAEIVKHTGLSKRRVYEILDEVGASRMPGGSETKWIVYSGDDGDGSGEEKETKYERFQKQRSQ